MGATTTGRRPRPAEATMLEAARAIEAEGGPRTWAALLRRTRFTQSKGSKLVRNLKLKGLWDHEFARTVRRPGVRRGGKPPERDAPEVVEAALAAAAALADPEGRVSAEAVARRLSGSGISRAQARRVVTGLKDRGGWPYRCAAQGEEAADDFRADPADLAREAEAGLGAMVDASAERDDPLRLGGRAPWSGRGSWGPQAGPTAAEACRAIVGEWKRRTGRVRPRPEPAEPAGAVATRPRGSYTKGAYHRDGSGAGGESRADRRREPSMVVRWNGECHAVRR